MMELKRIDGSVIATGENFQSLVLANKTDLSGANLSGANLSRANLSRANLRWADLRWADLRAADLRWADLSGADLSWADLSGADLRWADLSGADLRSAKLNWQSHSLLGVLLFQAAGESVAKRKLAGLITVSTDWCWNKFLAFDDPDKQWALETLADYVVDGDESPEVVRKIPKSLEAK